jgi:hypothetical protein
MGELCVEGRSLLIVRLFFGRRWIGCFGCYVFPLCGARVQGRYCVVDYKRLCYVGACTRRREEWCAMYMWVYVTSVGTIS